MAERTEINGGGRRPLFRIGELSRRVGVRPETLRAWERRYGLLDPVRTDGNYRLYTAADEARVRAMTRLLEAGVSAAEAAQLAREAEAESGEAGRGPAEAGPAVPLSAAEAEPPGPGADAGTRVPASARSPVLAGAADQLLEALEGFDEAGAHELLDLAFARFSLDAVLSDLILPLLAEVGVRWASGRMTIAQEHFASELLRGRLLGAGRGWGVGGGSLALLACPEGERHDLGLIAFGLALRERGWRIAFLGADTPPLTMLEAADELEPAAVVVAAADPERFEESLRTLRSLGERHLLLIGGGGANAEIARTVGAAHLQGDPVTAARWVYGSRPAASV